jgi:hypothetical protein
LPVILPSPNLPVTLILMTLLLIPRSVDLPSKENLPSVIFRLFAIRLPPDCTPLRMHATFSDLIFVAATLVVM